MKYILFIIICIGSFGQELFSQEITKLVRGSVVDKLSREPLIGATVLLLDSSKSNGVFCDADGKFRLLNVPLGRQFIRVSFLGYKEASVSIVVTSGKEVVLEIELEQSVIQGKEINITA